MQNHLPDKKNKRRRWPIIIFGCVFLSIGAAALYFFSLAPIIDYYAMKQWRPIEATLISAGVEASRSDDGNTYRAYATYNYEYDGKVYTGDRVALLGGSDNLGNFQQELGEKLVDALQHNETYTIYVDPEDPSSSIVDKTLRTGALLFFSIFGAVFFLIGFVALWFAAVKPKTASLNKSSLNTDKTATTATTELPGAPTDWQQAHDWAGNAIKSDAFISFMALAIFSALWNLITWPILFFNIDSIRNGNFPIIIAVLFPLAGIISAFFAIRLGISWKKFGALTLTLDPFPGAIGGDVGGQILTDIPYSHNNNFEVRLTCIYSYMTGSGDKRKRRSDTLWVKTGTGQQKPEGNRTAVEFLFNVDADLPEASLEHSGDYYQWTLTIRSELPGIDLNRTFNIPVFPTGKKSVNIEQSSEPEEQSSWQNTLALEKYIQISQQPGAIVLQTTELKNPFPKVAGIIAGIGLLLFGYIYWDTDNQTLPPNFLMAGCALLTLLTLIKLFSTKKIIIGTGEIVVQHLIFGLMYKKKNFSRTLIHSISSIRGATASIDGNSTTNFSIVLNTNNKKNVTLIKKIPGETLAQHAVESISLLTGITPQ